MTESETNPEATIIAMECRWVDGPDPSRTSSLMTTPAGVVWGIKGIENHTVIPWSAIKGVFVSDRRGAPVAVGHMMAFGVLGYAKRKRTVVGTVQVITAADSYTFDVEKSASSQLRAKFGPSGAQHSVTIS